MKKEILVSIKDEEKEFVTKRVMLVCYISSIITFISTITYYFSSSNQYTKNWVDPSLLKSTGSWNTTIDIVEKEIYEMPSLYISILILVIAILYTFIYVRNSRCKLKIENSLLIGTPTSGGEITLPIQSINSISINSSKSSINISTNNADYDFVWIKNNEEIKERIIEYK